VKETSQDKTPAQNEAVGGGEAFPKKKRTIEQKCLARKNSHDSIARNLFDFPEKP
jgi:hypothetical protein